MSKLYWGVFKHDCYKLPKSEIDKAFIRSFDDFKEALAFAEKYPQSAIHPTRKRPRRTTNLERSER